MLSNGTLPRARSSISTSYVTASDSDTGAARMAEAPGQTWTNIINVMQTTRAMAIASDASGVR